MTDVSFVPPETTAASEWAAALRHILTSPKRVQVHYQPVVDLRHGVVRGYEALARFPDAPTVPPRDWFDAAAQLGCSGALEAQVLEAALVSRSLLARKRFISVNVSPAALLSDEVGVTLTRAPSLEGLVVEVVESFDGVDPAGVRAVLDTLRRRGAAVAVDGVGGSYDDLGRITAFHPEFVKLDGGTLTRLGSGPQRAELLETYGVLADKLGAWLVVKGIEDLDQLDTVVRLGLPLGQGYVLGRPTPSMGEVPRELTTRIRQRTLTSVATTTLVPLIEQVPPVRQLPAAMTAAFAAAPGVPFLLCVDPQGFPTGVIGRAAHERGERPRPALLIPAAVSLSEAARRAVARPLESRFDPLVCVDQSGTPEGVVTVDRLLSALAR